ncbi:MAG: tetratricopeptide repeat protein [Candidatus Obscuribacter sp.]|nr:tetratricopeptide repeat protein [Candidatus Obscuribacter sp.]
MIDIKIERLLAADMERARRRTVVAASIGISSGLALSIGLPIYLLLHHHVSSVSFFVAAVIGPVPFSLLQRKLQYHHQIFLAELVGYMGLGVGFLLVPFLSASGVTLLQLLAKYIDEGRGAMVLSFSRFISFFYSRSPLEPMQIRLAIKASQVEEFYNYGQYEKGANLLDSLLSECERLYKSQPSADLLEGYCMAQTICISLLNQMARYFEWPYGNLASLLIDEGRYKEADAVFSQALEINPYYVNALVNMAEGKRKQHDFKAAREYLDRALNADPEDLRANIMRILPDI